MAIQRRFSRARGRDSRLVQIISILGAHRRELRAAAGERLRLLDERMSRAAPLSVELEARLAGLEERLERARLARLHRGELRRERIVRLREQLEILRGPTHPAAANSRVYQLGTVLMYMGGLAVLWVILFELGLALGLS